MANISAFQANDASSILATRTKDQSNQTPEVGVFCYYDDMKEFNKLVRDKIPEIIRSHGETPHYRILENEDEYLQALLQKDIEEGRELAEDQNLEELADKLEVLYAIAKARGYKPAQIEQARLEKLASRGGFDDRIFLESTD